MKRAEHADDGLGLGVVGAVGVDSHAHVAAARPRACPRARDQRRDRRQEHQGERGRPRQMTGRPPPDRASDTLEGGRERRGEIV